MLEADRAERVYELSVGRVYELGARGALPALPPQVAAWNQRRRQRQATIADVSSLRWFAYGDPTEVADPAAVMAIQQRYDYHTTAESLELTHIAGKAVGMHNLLRFAVALGEASGMAVSGELDHINARFMAFVHKHGFRAERVRFTHLAGDLT